MRSQHELRQHLPAAAYFGILLRRAQQFTDAPVLLQTYAAEFSAFRGDRSCGWLPQSRSEVLARNGMVATSHPLGAQAGLQVLQNGGNAFDAAVATAAVMNVVEPCGAGIGGDVFVIAWAAREGRLIALNGSGRAARGATAQHLKQRGHAELMPQLGIDSAVVPGAVDAWDALLKRAGTLTFKELLQPAADIAAEGFAVTERIHHEWAQGASVLAADPDSIKTYLQDGKPPPVYGVFRNPDLARTFRTLQTQGRDGFYSGEIGVKLLAKSRALGGALDQRDLDETRADWVSPICTTYHGYEVHEFPPSTQGFAVLEMLNILEACAPILGLDLKALGPKSPLYWHLLVEAKKLAYEDLHAFNADPLFEQVPLARLVSKSHAAELCRKIDPHRASVPKTVHEPAGGTVYLATADRWGNMVSFIFSIYQGFGSGITVPGCGFVLNNRAALFSLDPRSPNRIAPGKRPFHTLLPGFVTQDGRPLMAFGLMGAAQQAQGHVQVLIDLLDLGANVQAASDAARFSHDQATNTLQLESTLYDLVGPALRDLGHNAVSCNGEGMGGYQAIALLDGVYRGGSDHRKDGQAVGW